MHHLKHWRAGIRERGEPLVGFNSGEEIRGEEEYPKSMAALNIYKLYAAFPQGHVQPRWMVTYHRDDMKSNMQQSF